MLFFEFDIGPGIFLGGLCNGWNARLVRSAVLPFRLSVVSVRFLTFVVDFCFRSRGAVWVIACIEPATRAGSRSAIAFGEQGVLGKVDRDWC